MPIGSKNTVTEHPVPQNFRSSKRFTKMVGFARKPQYIKKKH